MVQSAESSPNVSGRLQSVEGRGSPYVSRRSQDVEERKLLPIPEPPSTSPSSGNSKRWRSCREVEEIRSPPPGCLSPVSSLSDSEDEVSLPPEQTSAGDNPGADEEIVDSQSDAADSFELGVHAFTFEEIKVATENFRSRAEATGTVYTGILRDGCEIAVKRFPTSEDLLDKLRQEKCIFSSLYHLNIARLLGYCSETNEFMLIYEFTQSRTLANFLHHDGETRSQLNWERTYKICLEIAEGLSYLHNDSGMKVIHGDINPTNIFLDADFNPKITNFPFSLCLSNDHLYSDTNAEELFKTLVEKDVYNYGLVILALVSGNCFSEANETLHHTYQLHEIINTRGNLLQFVDPRFGSAYYKKKAALLLDLCCSCTKDDSMLRPSVTEVLSSLKGERGLPELNHVQLQDDVITEMVNIDGGIRSMVSVPDPLTPATKPLHIFSSVGILAPSSSSIGKLASPSIGVTMSSSVDLGVEELASVGAAMSPSITRDFDVGIPIDYVPSPEPEAFYSKMQHSIIENFKEAVVPELSTKRLLELVQSTTRILISMSLSLDNWRNYTLSLLRIWEHRDQTIPTDIDSLHQRISSTESSISLLSSHSTSLVGDIAEFDIQIADISSKASAAEQKRAEYEAKVKQASEEFDTCTLFLGHLEQSRLNKVDELAREKVDLVSTEKALADLKTQLKLLTKERDEAFLTEYKVVLDNFDF